MWLCKGECVSVEMLWRDQRLDHSAVSGIYWYEGDRNTPDAVLCLDKPRNPLLMLKQDAFAMW